MSLECSSFSEERWSISGGEGRWGGEAGGGEGGEICQDVIYERRLKNEWGLRKWEAHGKITFKCWNSLF